MSDNQGQLSATAMVQRDLAPCAKAELPSLLPAPKRPGLVVRGARALRTDGIAYAMRRTAEVAHLLPERPAPVVEKPKRRWPPREDEELRLQPGELVAVKSVEEVRETLDDESRYKGLLFMDEMWKFCGQQFTVLRRMERIFSEATSVLHSGIKNTVLLEEAHCDGADHGECDARCFHMWREVWLRRVDQDA